MDRMHTRLHDVGGRWLFKVASLFGARLQRRWLERFFQSNSSVARA